MKVKLNSRAMAQMLKSDKVRKWLHTHADPVAASASLAPEVTRNHAAVVTEDNTTDRATVTVEIKHANGVGIEAKHGTLSRAASNAGLPMRNKEKT